MNKKEVQRGKIFIKFDLKVVAESNLIIVKYLNVILNLMAPLLKAYSQNLWRHILGNKQLQCTYCPISQEVKAIIQWNLVN